ncbi:hypothetical protein O181_001522 [Austropuccinia psidii MF-1]|uniref:P-loop containing nucleoside triphosphate hydrolase protein n=1 Tax=Austropuccinia psidii MF-1 TaxID=1389203 RepID=A0A9Q3BAZ5_9BASI|nr:hypothetical protein [Austropuccinia psidii MF-1]
MASGHAANRADLSCYCQDIVGLSERTAKISFKILKSAVSFLERFMVLAGSLPPSQPLAMAAQSLALLPFDTFNVFSQDHDQSDSAWLSIWPLGCTLWLPLLLLSLNLLSILPRPNLSWRFFQPFLTIADLDEKDIYQLVPPPWKQRFLLASTALLSSSSVAISMYDVVRGSRNEWNYAIDTTALSTWLFSLAYLCRYTVTKPPYLVMLLWLSTALAELGKILLALESNARLLYLFISWRTLQLSVIIALLYVAGSYPILDRLPSQHVSCPGSVPTSKETCPEDRVNLWQWLSFSFITPLLKIAHHRTLQEADVWLLSPFFQHRLLFNRYLRLIKEEYCPKNNRVSLTWILIRSNSLDLLIGLVVHLWSTVVGFVSTYAIKRILDGLSIGDQRSSFRFAILHFLCNMSFAQFDLCGKWHTRRCYERTRGQLFCILHDKALRRKDFSGSASMKTLKESSSKHPEEKSHADIGKISNLMGGDAYEIAERFWRFPALVTTPIRLLLALGFLYRLLGWSAFMGGIVVGVAYLLNWPLIKFDVKFSKAYSSARDKRMSLATETIQSIRFLKYMGWEQQWTNKVQTSRQIELQLRIKQMILFAIISFVWIWVPTAVLLVSFWAFTSVFHQSLTVSIAFTSISLFSTLQWALQELPNQITSWLKAFVSIRRIEDFLSEEDVPSWVTSLTRTESQLDETILKPGLVRFKAASFTWPMSGETENTCRFKLGPLECEFPIGKLTLVTGPTGAGKSTLLAAILGELDCIEGSVHVDKSFGQLAYAAQTYWLESATIRNNIVFQSEFDQNRYDAVIRACALEHDLNMMPHGDMTEIGEKGISLSGGQKARITLARAIYSKAKILLLDDPLSAVDMHTARTLVEDGLRSELLRDRTVVLVTHHLSLCRPAASLLIYIKAGRLDYIGPARDFNEDLCNVTEALVQKEGTESHSEASTVIGHSEFDNMPKRLHTTVETGDGRLIEEERRQEGQVSGSTYLNYLRAAGWGYWILILLLIIYARLTGVASQWILKLWGEAYPHSAFQFFSILDPTKGFPRPDIDVNPWIRLYLIIGLNSALAILAGLAIGNLAKLKASRKLFTAMLTKIVGSTIRWHDITPTGRILNRLVSDIDTVDFALHNTCTNALRGIIAFMISLFVVIIIVPKFAPIALFVSWLYIRLAPDYVKTARDLRRLESVSRSPMFQNFSNLLYGIQSIRAFAAEERYENLFYKSCDTFQAMDHHYWLANFWLMWRYDCLGSVVVFLTTSFALASGVSEGFAAISVVQAEIFAQATRSLVSVFAQLELDFNAVERISEYLEIPQEAPAIIEASRPPAYWPSDNSGLIVEDLVVKYAEHLPPVLKYVSFTIEPRQKVGLVGRTGSGKSTLALSFLRILEPSEGKIILDGIDIAKIGLEDLRTRITIVSQDVTLFEGTIRDNLDPLGAHSDQECWDVLRRCGLASEAAVFSGNSISSTTLSHEDSSENIADCTQRETSEQPMIESLDMRLSEGGRSFSAGQRQMLALARAMLRETKIIIMDEATASIDLSTDAKIQATIRDFMSTSMVITIAHRLFTVIDYDKILVLNEGKLVEAGSPRELIKRPKGEFRRMCELSTDWKTLKRMIGSGEAQEEV